MSATAAPAVALPGAEAIIDPSTYARSVPHELFARLRATSPVVRVAEPAMERTPQGPGLWAVLGHAEVGHVLRTPSVFSASLGLTQIVDAPPPLLPTLRSMMINMDPPVHSRLRGLLTKSFTPRAVGLIEHRIRQRAEDLVAAAPASGECDFARDVVADLALSTLADVLGVPEVDRWLMFDWGNRVIGMLDAEYTDSAVFDAGAATPMARRALASRPLPGPDGRMPDPRMPSGMADLFAYARELAAHRRTTPGEDVMSLLLQQVDADGGRVSAEEFEMMFWLFCVAGNETVRNAVPGALYALLEHPDQMAALRAAPELLERATEELLRWWAPVIQFRRTATTDTELGGALVRAGDKVVVFFPAANRDPAVFDRPDELDVRRSPNPHLSFGHGPHFCVAAHLARVQVRAVIAAVLRQWSHVELAGEPVRLRSNFQNGIKHLPVRYSRA